MSQLPFVAVGSVADERLLAFYCPCSAAECKPRTSYLSSTLRSHEFQELFLRMLKVAKAKMAPSEKIKLQWNSLSLRPRGATL
eukprot:1497893-Amphidinium_carterae.1